MSYELGRMVLYLSLIMWPGTSSSAALTKFGGIFCRKNTKKLNIKSNCNNDNLTLSFQKSQIFLTWYSVFSVCVSFAACCSAACASGRDEVWSSWSKTSLGVVTEQKDSTPKELTSNSRERLEPRLETITYLKLVFWAPSSASNVFPEPVKAHS